MRRLVIIFGGRSSEHEISVISAINISKQVDTDKYELILIGITKEGKWLKVENISSMEDGSWINSKNCAFILPDATKKCIIVETDGEYKEIHVDVVFPVLHGLYGEDGTVQGLLELAKIPYPYVFLQKTKAFHRRPSAWEKKHHGKKCVPFR